MTRNEAQSMRRRGGGATTRGGEVDAEFSPTPHTNIQTFKDGIFHRDENIRLETAGGNYTHIGRAFSIISTGCLRVSGGVFDGRMRVAARDERQRRGSKTEKKLYIKGCGIEP
jgi:Tfp pilus assembly protein FimT